MASINSFLFGVALFLLLLLETDGTNKTVVVKNIHNNYLSLRCFSFTDNSTTVQHLAEEEEYRFNATRRTFYASATMYNCSTNMGTFVAYKYDYECAMDEHDSCRWEFNEEIAKLLNPSNDSWIINEYSPNYESLDRGGVNYGTYAN